MNRESLKTLGGILVIGIIVVATFLYGNQQRQEQLRKDQAQQEQSNPEVAVDNSKPQGSEPNLQGGEPAVQNPATPQAGATIPETGAGLNILALASLSVAVSMAVSSRRALARVLAQA